MLFKVKDYTITLKDFCPRKLKKEINKRLFKNLTMKATPDGQKIDGFSPESLDEANDTALLGMTEKIEINNELLKIDISTFDDMDSEVVDKIIEEINKITNKQIPNV